MKSIAVLFLIGLLCCLSISHVHAQDASKKNLNQIEKKPMQSEKTVKTMQKVGKTMPVKINTARKEKNLAVPTKVVIDEKAVLEQQIEKLKSLIKLAESNPETYSKAYLEKYRQSLTITEAKLEQLQNLEN